jgi:hypothetical protein
MKSQVNKISGKIESVLSGENWLDFFLYLLFVAFFLAPFIDSPAVRLLTNLLFCLLMIAGVVSISNRTAIRFTAGLVAAFAIALRWLKYIVPTEAIFKLGTLASLVFLVILTMVALAKVFSKGRVTAHRIKGAIAVYLLIGMTWSLLYGLIDQVLPNAFNLPAGGDIFTPERQELLTYFSFVTLTTVGYGDITPTHEVSRMFAIIEALCGQLYPATLLARLVSLELMHRDDGASAD